MAKNYFGITDTGKMRNNNEDTFIAQTVLDDKFIAACVIDGVGGYEGGEIAARYAHDEILDTIQKSSGDVLDTMVKAFSAANEKIYKERKANKDHDQMACVLTLAMVDLSKNKFYYTHVGDTRLYLFRDSLVKVSHDHSFVGFLEDSGRLSEDAAMRHPKRNEINKALGFEAPFAANDYVETGESPFLPGDILLLCSDGLTDMINNSTITSILQSKQTLEQKGKELIAAANNAGGKDNITVVLVFNDKPQLKQEATKPVIAEKKEANTNTISSSNNDNTATKTLSTEKKKSNAVPILIFLCILFLASTLWMVYKTFGTKNVNAITVQEPKLIAAKQRNKQEQNLIDSLKSTSKLLVLSDSKTGRQIVISDSIFIQSDSLHIVGNGITFIADSAFAGPAFTLSPECKYVLLDSINFENFDIGILLQNGALHLKNVQFKNCRVPIQYQFLFPNNTVLNGRIADSLFYNTGSLHNRK
jgi:serine/threonine protein phosphatase PrpC